MRKVLFLLMLFISSVSFANTEGKNDENTKVDSFEIIVIDANTEEPIPAAQIKINENVPKVYTDFDGMAEFKDLSKGFYNIEISLVSYQKKQLKSFELDNSSNRLLVKLKP